MTELASTTGIVVAADADVVRCEHKVWACAPTHMTTVRISDPVIEGNLANVIVEVEYVNGTDPKSATLVAQRNIVTLLRDSSGWHPTMLRTVDGEKAGRVLRMQKIGGL